MNIYLDPLPGNHAPSGDFSYLLNPYPPPAIRVPVPFSYPRDFVSFEELRRAFPEGPTQRVREFILARDRSTRDLAVYEER